MKNVTVINASEKDKTKNRVTLSLKQHVLEPFKAGLFGFAIFISILLLVKLISYVIGSYNYFSLELADIQLSLVGFVLLFLIRFLENFKENSN